VLQLLMFRKVTAPAFSLVELAIVLAISGAIIAFLMKIMDASTTQDCYAATRTQMAQVRDAIERFAVAKDRFPMPSRRNVNVESPVYGREAIEADLDTVSGAVFGALPFQAIGIPAANAADCWGNKLTYVVTKDLTDATKFVIEETAGALNINSNNSNAIIAGAGYAIISHGEDQLGAVKNNYSASSNTLATRRWCTADGAVIRTQNCDVVNDVLVAAQFNNGKDAAANYFDDMIVYRGKPWRIGLINGACGSSHGGTFPNATPQPWHLYLELHG
jgi:type II secretory pathway pseudopilin PulG